MSLYEYEDEDEGRSLTRIIVGAVAVVVLAALLWFLIRPSLGGGGTTSASMFDPAPASTVAGETEATTTSGVSTTVSVEPTTLPVEPSTTTSSPTSVAAKVTADSDPTESSLDEETTASSVAAHDAPEQAADAASYPTLPDGSPVPVLAIFDTDTITLSGTVPSQAAADRLAQLAIANSKTPAALVQFLAINPDVPANVGVRVIEMTSSRFPDGSADILPDHGRELDRIGAVMNALPNTTVLVIGHADQRGSEAANFAISEERARAVVSHLVDYGIDASRLSSRAVGEADLLSLNNDETALQLNRRTEFVIYGTLLGT